MPEQTINWVSLVTKIVTRMNMMQLLQVIYEFVKMKVSLSLVLSFFIFRLFDVEGAISGTFRDFEHFEQDRRLDDCNSEKNESAGTN
jgi:hypothetical protein